MEPPLDIRTRAMDDECAQLCAAAALQCREARRATDDLHRTLDDSRSLRARFRASRRVVEASGWGAAAGAPAPQPPGASDYGLLVEERDGLLSWRKDMLDSLAYQVRQPLNNASAALQSASRAIAGGSERERHQAQDRLQRAHAVLTRMASMLDNRLADAVLLGGTATAHCEDVDVDTLLRLVISDIDARDRGRVRIRRDTPTRTACLHPGLIRLALRNLVENGLAYSPAGSPVEVGIADSDDPLALCLDVCDQGPGLPAPWLPRLSAQGERAAGLRGAPGPGLGLHIVRRVAELHGGTIVARPLAPGGLCMRLLVPQDLSSN